MPAATGQVATVHADLQRNPARATMLAELSPASRSRTGIAVFSSFRAEAYFLGSL
jgi:hypothetical protein